jgi:N-acetylmuramoyl-L-alanine amidase
VSIHADSIPGRRQVHGAATYFHGGHLPSRSLAEKVQQSLVRATRSPDLGVRADTTRFPRGFYLLREAKRPAVLVEIGFLSHAPTAKLLAQPAYRQKVAEAIGVGVLEYLKAATP